MQKKLPVIELRNVTKRYSLKQNKPTLAEQLFRRNDLTEFTALDNISLKIYEGESVGIIGHNGSGKTTLLKLIAGITTPNEGKVTVRRRVVSLIDLGAGFNEDLTGWENIFLNGMVLGMNHDEIKRAIPHIVAFADIGKFINSPMFTYSDGMRLRLGFSIAVHSKPEILLLDEGMVVGDADFQQKSKQRILNLIKEKNITVILAAHWLKIIQAVCKHVMLMSKGSIQVQGGTEVLKIYDPNFEF